MTFLVAAGPVVAVLLAAAVATRALVIAGGPTSRVQTRPLSALIVVLMLLFVATIAIHFLAPI